MTTMAVVTPTYAPDYDLFCDLHRSVLAFTESSVVHYAITPARDMPLFSRLAGPRLVVWPESEVLPRRVVPVPSSNVWLNLRRPLPPIRSWVVQQILKLAVAARMGADVVVMVDSDVLLIRPLRGADLVVNGAARFYRLPGAVDARLPRHLSWHAGARKMLGLPSAPAPYSDYVTSFNVWDPRIVRHLQNHVAGVNGQHWVDCVGAQIHFSEWTLYGVFVDEVLGESARANVSDETLCHSYWDPVPLDEDAARAFVGGLTDRHRAIMISAKSKTPLDVRRAALAPIMGTAI